MNQHESLAQRLTVLKQRIDRAEQRMRLKLFLHQEEQATLEALRARYTLLEQQLDHHAAASAEAGHPLDSFERTVEWWIRSLRFER